MTVLRLPLDNSRFESDQDLEAAFEVDYFDERLQCWIACASLRDHIFDDDSDDEDDRVIAWSGSPLRRA